MKNLRYLGVCSRRLVNEMGRKVLFVNLPADPTHKYSRCTNQLKEHANNFRILAQLNLTHSVRILSTQSSADATSATDKEECASQAPERECPGIQPGHIGHQVAHVLNYR